MIKKVTLSTGKVFDPKEVMPTVKKSEKVGIFFTGGVESTLVALMMIKKYGVENVVFVFMSLNRYSNYKDNREKFYKIQKDFARRVETIGGIHVMYIDDDDANNCDEWYGSRSIVDWATQKISKNFGVCKFVFAGYSNIHRENMQLLEDCGWESTIQLKEQVKQWAHDRMDDYPEVRDFLINCGGDIYFVTESVAFTIVQQHYYQSIRPLNLMTKPEVLELYEKFSLIEELAQTISCNNPAVEASEHCGICKNCKQRQKAFEAVNIEDQTTYVN